MAIGSFVQVILYIIFSLIYLVSINYGLQGVDPAAASIVMLICEIMFKVLIFIQMVHIFISVFPFFINQSSLLNIQAQYKESALEGNSEMHDKSESEKSQAIDAETVMIKSGALYEVDTDQAVFNKKISGLDAEDIELQ